MIYPDQVGRVADGSGDGLRVPAAGRLLPVTDADNPAGLCHSAQFLVGKIARVVTGALNTRVRNNTGLVEIASTSLIVAGEAWARSTIIDFACIRLIISTPLAVSPPLLKPCAEPPMSLSKKCDGDIMR